MQHIILTINPGSTSTKVALFNRNETLLAEKTIRHTKEELSVFKSVGEQKGYRLQLIYAFMEESGYQVREMEAVVGRGGLLKPMPGGTYLVDEEMLDDLRNERFNTHASNLGAVLADELGKRAGVPAYIVDPVVVDEMQELAKISGLKGIQRRSVSHVLNQKAVARDVLALENKDYADSQVIVAHMGGGISVGAHAKGKLVDVVNGLDGEGPYSPERTGALPLYPFAQKMIEDGLTIDQVKQLIAGSGGIQSYLGESDLRRVLERIDAGDVEAKLYLDGMCYQVGKAIGEMATVLKGQAEHVILTGGVAYSSYIVEQIKEAVEWIAPVSVVPGEKEMEALCAGVVRVLTGKEKAKSYGKRPLEW